MIVLVGTGFRALVLSIQILVFLRVKVWKMAISSRLIHKEINYLRLETRGRVRICFFEVISLAIFASISAAYFARSIFRSRYWRVWSKWIIFGNKRQIYPNLYTEIPYAPGYRLLYGDCQTKYLAVGHQMDELDLSLSDRPEAEFDVLSLK